MFKFLKLLAPAIALFPLTALAGAPPHKSYYCIQLLSSRKVTGKELEKFRELSGRFKQVRIEKIGGLYTLRLGFWEKPAEARKLLPLLKEMGFKEAFMRKCYYLPERWVLPRRGRKARGEKQKNPRKVNKKGTGKKIEEKKLKKLLTSLLNEKTKPEKREIYRLNFPETRKGSGKERKFTLETLVSANRDLYQTYSLTKLLYRGNGVAFERKEGKNRLGIALNLWRRFWIKDAILVRAGFFNRGTWTPLSLELSLDMVDKRSSISISYQPFRNFENEVNLRGLFSVEGRFKYFFTDSSNLTLSALYDRFTCKRDEAFSTGSRFSVRFSGNRLSTEVSFRGSSYLGRLSFKGENFRANLFTDRKLELLPHEKGRLYSQGWNGSLLALDPYNLSGVALKAIKEPFSLSGALYVVNDREKPVILGLKRLKPGSNYLGFTLGVGWNERREKRKIRLLGGFFFPGSAFSNRKPRAGGYLDVRLVW